MFSPPHTCHASASAILPAEPQYWTQNLPAGHGKCNSCFYMIQPLGFARSDSNNTRSIVHTAWMMIIYFINTIVCSNFITTQTCAVRIQNCSDGFIWRSVGLMSSKPL